jgi:hypothetical protein
MASSGQDYKGPDDRHHDHDHDHHHDHGHGGLIGAVRGFVAPHSHDPKDSLDQALEASRDGIRAVAVSMVILLVTPDCRRWSFPSSPLLLASLAMRPSTDLSIPRRSLTWAL